ncbi:uncharacterized protein LOC128165975 [Crassostrea angulata]|uniref:uncharacterized protein LOC128165975 n=1 Tax=Magallana angulata TaxID=2784310 RepID=UPI0022B08E8B|nr:uncharacterized protein LOC128165975 [Crassostrea angulata]
MPTSNSASSVNNRSSFSDLQKCVDNMQLTNQTKIAHPNSKKQEICVSTEKAIQELKKMIDVAFSSWTKRFELIHADSIGILELASDELKRFSTTVLETKILLQSMLENGSAKQLFITKQSQLARIVDHVSRLKSQDIWNFSREYTQQDTRFCQQLLNHKKFEDVKMSRVPSGTIETILQSISKAYCSNFLRRKHEMSKKDWMKVTFKLVSQIISLPERSYYGLFIHDTNIILSFMNPPSLKIFDINEPGGKCIHTEECPSPPYGLCHSRVNENLNEVYVSFENRIVLYWIDVEDNVNFIKLRTIKLIKPMQSISCGLTTLYSANSSKAFICSPDFVIERESLYSKGFAAVPFLFSSSKSDFHAFTRGGRVVVVDRNYKQNFHSF